MNQAKLSSKFQLSIPKKIREQQGLRAGQVFTVIERGHILELIPFRPLAEAKGIIKTTGFKDSSEYRDRSERLPK